MTWEKIFDVSFKVELRYELVLSLFQVKKISNALISAEINDEEVDEELERFRLQRSKESGREEQDAKEALVYFQWFQLSSFLILI
jgi:hypothetical protein